MNLIKGEKHANLVIKDGDEANQSTNSETDDAMVCIKLVMIQDIENAYKGPS